MSVFWLTILIMGGVGLVAAVLLYIISKKFYVHEDARIAEVESILAGANCGACGFKGCHDFACACVKATSLDGYNCPSIGAAGMQKIAGIVGLAAGAAQTRKAVVACAGTCEMRPSVRRYDGVSRCAIEAAFCEGTTDCPYGCLGCGDCVQACPYDALHMDRDTNLPVVDLAKCVGCGKCVKACPRGVMELAVIPAGQSAITLVSCRNRDKGAQAMKECKVSCIGCGKCKKVCESEAVTLTGPLAFIDTEKCIRCGKCQEACPRKSINTVTI